MEELLRLIFETEISDYTELDYSSEYVSEATLRLYPEGTVIYGYFPYKSTRIKEHSPSTWNHYGIVIYDKVYGIIVVMCTSKVKKHEHNKLAYLIPAWADKGFTAETCALATSVYNVSRIENIEVRGKMHPEDIRRIKSMVKVFLDKRFKMFEYLLSWLKWNEVADTKPIDGMNNNNNPLQDVTDIDITHTANCVDMATLVHHVASVTRVHHYIVRVRFVNATKTSAPGHLFVIYRDWSRKWRIFRYMDKIGDIVICGTNKMSALSKEFEKLVPHFTERFGYRPAIEYMLIDKDGFELWDSCVKRKTTQRFLLDKLDTMYTWITYSK